MNNLTPIAIGMLLGGLALILLPGITPAALVFGAISFLIASNMNVNPLAGLLLVVVAAFAVDFWVADLGLLPSDLDVPVPTVTLEPAAVPETPPTTEAATTDGFSHTHDLEEQN